MNQSVIQLNQNEILSVLKQAKKVMDADHYNAEDFDSLYDNISRAIDLAEGCEI